MLLRRHWCCAVGIGYGDCAVVISTDEVLLSVIGIGGHVAGTFLDGLKECARVGEFQTLTRGVGELREERTGVGGGDPIRIQVFKIVEQAISAKKELGA